MHALTRRRAPIVKQSLNLFTTRRTSDVFRQADKVGRIDAISVETGRTVWSWETRVANYSPLLATGSGLLFNGGLDHYLRGFDADTGKVIWETRLPSQTIGGAITYSVNGRQYIAIAAGGGAVAGTQFSLTPEADMAGGNNAIYVFALPQ